MDRVFIQNQPAYAKHVVVEVQWTTASTRDFKGTRTKLKTEGWDWIELSSSKSDRKEMTNYGAALREELPRQGQPVSLAAWLANSCREGTVVAFETVKGAGAEETCVWCCIVNDGQVVTGTDMLYPDAQSAEEAVRESLEALGETPTAVIGSDAPAMQGWTSEEEVTPLAEVLSKAGYKRACFKAAAGGNDRAAVIVLAVGMVVIAGAGFAWFAANYMAESDAVAQAEQARESQTKKAQRQYQQILRDVGAKHRAGETVTALWNTVLRDTETKVGGWELQSIECKAGNCSAQYENTNLTLPRYLKTALAKQCKKLTIGADGTTAVCTSSYTGNPLVNDMVTSPAQIDAVLLNEGDVDRLRAKFMTVARLGTGTGYAVNEAIQYPFRGSRYLPLVEMFTQGEWVLRLPIRLLSPVAQSLSEHAGMSLDELTVNWGSHQVELRGLYFSAEDRKE